MPSTKQRLLWTTLERRRGSSRTCRRWSRWVFCRVKCDQTSALSHTSDHSFREVTTRTPVSQRLTLIGFYYAVVAFYYLYEVLGIVD